MKKNSSRIEFSLKNNQQNVPSLIWKFREEEEEGKNAYNELWGDFEESRLSQAGESSRRLLPNLDLAVGQEGDQNRA